VRPLSVATEGGWPVFLLLPRGIGAEPSGLGPAHRHSGRSGRMSRSRSAAFPAPSASPAWPTAFSPGSNTRNLPASRAQSEPRPVPEPAPRPRWPKLRTQAPAATAGAEGLPIPNRLGGSRSCCTCADCQLENTRANKASGNLTRFASRAVTSDRPYMEEPKKALPVASPRRGVGRTTQQLPLVAQTNLIRSPKVFKEPPN
jgi:hypothetical protein